jgi:hypothetical protein
MATHTISLKMALSLNRLDDFIAQEEARSIGPVICAELDAAIALLVKLPRSKGRTSRSASRGGSRG